MPDAEQMEELDRAVIARGEPRQRQAEWRRSDGTRGTFVVIKTPWRAASGAIAGVVTVIHDITEIRDTQQRLAVVQGELVRASRLSAMGAMASGLAHELNQPLAAATNFLNAAGRLLARTSADPDALMLARGAVADAAAQTLRAGAIVRRLRNFVGRGGADLRPDDICGVIREAIDVARTDRATGALDLEVRLPAEPVVCLADRTQIQQVLLNLLRNAAEAIGSAPDGRIEIACEVKDGVVEILVAHNGPGLAPEVADKLFQPFTSTKPSGMGIGLAICQTIIEAHGGSMAAETGPAGGARFTIVLPLPPARGFQTGEEGGSE